MADIARPSQHTDEEGVTANPLDPGRGDWPVEEAQAYMRSAIFNSPEVIDHLLALADLREEWRESPNRGKLRAATLCGETFWIDATYPERLRYERARDSSPLRRYFSAGYIDDRVSVIRDRLSNGFWGPSSPSDVSAGYGRQRGAYPSMDPDTIELAVADLVQEQFGGPKNPNLERPTRVLGSKVRQYRRRLGQLAVS